MRDIHIVAGGQFGSEGKGHISAFLTRHLTGLARADGRPAPLVIRTGGPNAGHTAYDSDGRPWRLRHIPAAAVVDPDVQLAIAPGSEIDTGVLSDEIGYLEDAGHKVRERLWVDGQATIIQERHLVEEKALRGRIGSTAKGIGAARASRVMRDAIVWADIAERSTFSIADVPAHTRQHLAAGGDVVIEGTQGYGLGLHAGWYPYCTSGDIRAVDLLAQAGLSPWEPDCTYTPWVVLRTYPIRVAGNSGPLAMEQSWSDMQRRVPHLAEPETTTVTGKVRRIGMWDTALARAAVQANGLGRAQVAVTFLDYVFPHLYRKAPPVRGGSRTRYLRFIREIEQQTGAPVAIVTTGPDSAYWT